MRVLVRILLSPERVLRDETLELELPAGATVRELLARLDLSPAERLEFLTPDGTGLATGMGVLVDRQNVEVFGQGLETVLEESNTVSLIHLLSGG